MNIQLCGVYKLYKLGRGAEGYNVKMKTLQRDNHVVTNSYAESINVNHQVSGLYYIKDEEATKEYYTNAQNKKSGISDAEIVGENTELDNLKKEYKEIFSKAPHHKMTAETIKAKIQEAKQ